MLLSSTGTGLPGHGQTKTGSNSLTSPFASPPDTDDMLYEYFPLSLDDW